MARPCSPPAGRTLSPTGAQRLRRVPAAHGRCRCPLLLLLLPPQTRGARPASPSQIRSRRCRFTLCRSIGRAGPRHPRRRGRTRDPVTRRPRRSGGTGKTQLGSRERHRRHGRAARFRFRSADVWRVGEVGPGETEPGRVGALRARSVLRGHSRREAVWGCREWTTRVIAKSWKVDPGM